MFDQYIQVWLQFRGMHKPICVCVPNYVLRYLDHSCDRLPTHDGTFIYCQPGCCEENESERQPAVV